MNSYMVTFESYGDVCDMVVLAANRIMAMEMFKEMTKEWNETPLLIGCWRMAEGEE